MRNLVQVFRKEVEKYAAQGIHREQIILAYLGEAIPDPVAQLPI